ncbi:MAG: Rrf2 family transcriptional regulator [Flavobacteriales bacterium]|nr:Rrf2 family transcriptional regulator [Flavobacteriales bacterium]
MLTNAAKYAIRSTLYLATNSSEENKVGVKKIAEELDVPLAFLAKLLQQLTKNNIVSSTKGPHGGFYLSEFNGRKTVWDIIGCIDGVEKFSQCFLGLPDCSNENPCSVHFLVTSFKNKMMKEFKDKDLFQMAKEMEGENEGKMFDI